MEELSNNEDLCSGDLLYCHQCLLTSIGNESYEDAHCSKVVGNEESSETDSGLARMFKKLFGKSKGHAAKTSPSDLDSNAEGAGSSVAAVCVLCQKKCNERVGDAVTVFGEIFASKPTGAAVSLRGDGALVACSPMLSYVICRPEGVGGVGGLAKLSCDNVDMLHVVRWGSLLEEYRTTSSILRRTRFIKDLGVNVRGLAASATHCSLFVSDATNNLVHRVDVIEGRRSIVMNWPVGSRPEGLSVNHSGNLLVTCNGSSFMQEFNPYGDEVMKLKFPEEIASPRHVVEMPPYHAGDSRSFVISHSPSGLCIVNHHGVVTRRYGDKGLPAGALREPRNIAVDSSGHILVADSGKNRVVVFDQSLGRARELPLGVRGGLREPWALCLDETQGRLYVGEWSRRYVLAFSNVFNVASVL